MSEAETFDGLSEEFFSAWFRFHPDVAVGVGVLGFGSLLPAQSDDEVAALGAWLESLIVALEELRFDALDAERRIDAQLLFSLARVEHQELLERDWRHRDPSRFLPVAEIYHLTLRPPEDFRAALQRLLERMPEHLRAAQTQLRSMAELVAPTMQAVAARDVENGRCYLRELLASAWLRQQCSGRTELEALADQACAALRGFGEFLDKELKGRAAGRIDCGAGHLRFLLKHRHFLECDPVAIRELLERVQPETTRALDDLCAELGIAPGDATDYLSHTNIGGGGRLENYRRECDRIEQWLRSSGLLTLPDVPLWIGERPTCPWPHRFGADYVADFDGATGGTFFLNSVRQSPDTLGEPMAAVRGRCLAQTWGGAHLLAFGGGEAARRLPRRVAHGASLVDGWALYFRERLCREEDVGDDERLYDLMQQQSALSRARLDLDLHLGLVDQDEAMERLERDRLCEDGALAGLFRLVRHPGAAAAAVLGWQLLKEGASLLRERDGAGFSELDYHDRLLSHGPIPLSLVLQLEFGDDVPGTLLGRILS